MSRFARNRAVFFIEEPVGGLVSELRRAVCPKTGVMVCTPVLAAGDGDEALAGMIEALHAESGPANAWYYTPVMRAWSGSREIPSYPAGTWGPEEADGLLGRDGREWRRP